LFDWGSDYRLDALQDHHGPEHKETKGMIKPNPGDIVLLYRKQYKGPFKYLVTRAILFFTTAWWMGEPTSKVYHAELAVSTSVLSENEFVVATMEPPKYRYKNRRYTRKVIFSSFLDKGWVERKLDGYLAANLGKKYDFLRLVMMLLNWIFRTSFFTEHYKTGARDICSEAVARFYEHMGCPCSDVEANSTTPDDIYDFCRDSGKFRKVYDARE
jgi:hypothetical protein